MQVRLSEAAGLSRWKFLATVGVFRKGALKRAREMRWEAREERQWNERGWMMMTLSYTSLSHSSGTASLLHFQWSYYFYPCEAF